MWTLILFLIVATVTAKPGDEFYDDRYSNFNVKELIENTRLLKSYVLCILGKGKCTPEGNDFKKLTPEAVKTQCEKCSEKQRHLIAQVIRAILEKLPNDWEELSKEFDPKGDHVDKLNQFIQQYAPNEK